MTDEYLRKVVLHTGADPRAFNHFIGNLGGYMGFEPTTDTFEVNKDFIQQAALDGRATAYQAQQTQADTDYRAALEARKIGDLQQQFGADVNLNAVIEVMRLELNELRAQHTGLPDITEGAMDAKIRAEIANP